MDFETARRNMVESQIRTNKVTDPDVLAAMGELPRELFVPKEKRPFAYIDEDIEIARGRFLIEPAVLARLIQQAVIARGDVALVVGCGTGYAAAVVARLCDAVFALESDSELAGEAARLLSELSLDNVVVVEGPLEQGWSDQAPYDVILIDGAVGEVPETLFEQLAEGGRLLTVVRPETGMGRAVLYGRRRGAISRRELFDAAVPLLPEFRSKAGFVF